MRKVGPIISSMARLDAFSGSRPSMKGALPGNSTVRS